MSAQYLVVPCQHFTIGQLLTGMFCARHDCAGETITEVPDGSIVVDGKAVELEKAVAFVASESNIGRITKWLIDAAREVAS